MGEDGEAQIVPVDDERRAPQAGDEPRDRQRGDAGRVLHQDELGPGQVEEEQAEELEDQGRDLDEREEEEAPLPV